MEESALLAGLLKGPSIYSPLKNKELAIERRNLVLTMMADQGYITKKEAAPSFSCTHRPEDNALR